MNAWQLASNPESVAVTVTQRAYVKDYPVKADIGTFTLIKANFLSYLGIIVLAIVVIVLILLIIRAINLKNVEDVEEIYFNKKKRFSLRLNLFFIKKPIKLRI